jgi:hypothetical protein
MADRLAQCACGALTATAQGDPDAVVMCHCDACQRRSGSPFGVAGYWPSKRIKIAGAYNSYRRLAESGRGLTNHFCPTCGVTLFFVPENKVDTLGIPVGAFADPNFPPPVRSVWEQSQHPWCAYNIELQHFPRGRS